MEVSRNEAIVDLYPNPAREYITINSAERIREVQLITSSGLSRTIQADTNSIQLSTSGLVPGLVLVRVRTISSVVVKKLVIE